ncbi:hypothetical protein SHY80_11355, partial [Streptococcus suis]|nr:hypothetical protein [Streptococcus suis]
MAGVQATEQAGINFANHGSITGTATAMATGEVGLTKSGLDLTGTVGANVAITGTQQEQGTLVGGLSGGQMT